MSLKFIIDNKVTSYILLVVFSLLIPFFLCFNLGCYRVLDGDFSGYVYALRQSISLSLHNLEFPLWCKYYWSSISFAHAYFGTFNPIILLLCFFCFNSDSNLLDLNFSMYLLEIHYVIFMLGVALIIKQIHKNFLISIFLLLFCSTIPFVFASNIDFVSSSVLYLPLIIYFFKLSIDGNFFCAILSSILISCGITYSLAFGTIFLFISLSIFSIIAYIYEKDKRIRILKTAIIIFLLTLSFSAFPLFEFINFTNQSVRLVDGHLLEGTQKLNDFSAFIRNPGNFTSYSNLFLGNQGFNSWSVGILPLFLFVLGVCRKQKSLLTRYAITQFFIIFPFGLNIVVHIIFFQLPIINQIREQYIYIPLLVFPFLILVIEGTKSLVEKQKLNDVCLLVFFIISVSQILYPLENTEHKYLVYIENAFFLFFIICYRFSISKVNIISFLMTIVIVSIVCNVIYERKRFFTGMNVDEAKIVFENKQKQWKDYLSTLDIAPNNGIDRVFPWVCTSPANIFSQLGYSDVLPYMNPMYKKIFFQHIGGLDYKKRAFISNSKYIFTDNITEAGIWWNNNVFSLDKNLELISKNVVLPANFDNDTKTQLNVYKNNYRNGFAWFVDEAIYYNDKQSKEQIINLMNSDSFKPESVVAVNESSLKNADIIPSVLSSDDKVSLIDIGDHFVKLSVNVENDNILVTSNVYTKEWNAYIDDNKLDLFEVNYGYLGVVVPHGEHIICLKYEPRSATISLILLIIGVFVSCFVTIRQILEYYGKLLNSKYPPFKRN
ncbi:MAG: YfhO family protein [Succinivibrionaceae bacterium]